MSPSPIIVNVAFGTDLITIENASNISYGLFSSANRPTQTMFFEVQSDISVSEIASNGLGI